MNAVIYHSNTGESRKVAQYAAELLGYPLLDMLSLTVFSFEKLVIVFPVHCQNIPAALRPILPKLRSRHVVLLATYGRMSFGNVLQECQRRYRWRIVGGAYIPTSHCYIPNDPSFSRWEQLDFIAACLEADREVTFPSCFKNPLADLFPGTRSRLGVTILRNKACTGCGLCEAVCKNKRCIRCLKCVKVCPVNGKSIRLNPFMALYLKKRPRDQLVIYK